VDSWREVPRRGLPPFAKRKLEYAGSTFGGGGQAMQKVVWVMELKEHKVQDYIEVHKKENVWPEIIAVNEKAGVCKEEIFVFQNYVFIYLEVEDYERMMRVFEEDEGLKRWNKITLPMSKAASDLGSTMKRLPLIFDYENGELLH
jgi:L-rhamnose mutarotase